MKKSIQVSNRFAANSPAALFSNSLFTIKSLFLILILSASAFAVNLTDFGAIPNDGVSDSAALQQAFDTVCGNGGGEIVFPSGVTLLTNGVGGNCQFASELSLIGNDGSVIEINAPQSAHVFAAGNLADFRMKNFLVIGYTNRTDASTIFYINGQTVTFENVIFANLHFALAGVLVEYANLTTFRNVQFAGCGGNAMVYTYAAARLSIENSVFIDYFNYKNVYYSKSPWSINSWVKSIKNQDYPRALPSVKVDGSFFDEGAFYAVNVDNVDNFVFTGNRVNVNNGTNASGVRVGNSKTAVVDGNRFGFAGTKHSAAIFENVKRFEFSNNVLEAGIDHIWLKGNTQKGIYKFNDVQRPGPFVRNDSNALVEMID